MLIRSPAQGAWRMAKSVAQGLLSDVQRRCAEMAWSPFT